jgi:hypothetical protein
LSERRTNEALRRSGTSVEKSVYASMNPWMWPGYFLFFLMLSFPMVVSLLYVKALLFAILLIFVAVRGLTCFRLDLHPKVVIWTLALANVSLLFGFRGMFLGTPGALKGIQVYVMWPLVYLVLLGGIHSMRTLHALERTLIFSSAFIFLFGAAYSLSQLNILPEIPYLDSLISPDDLGSGVYDGYAGLAFPGLNSLPFLVPFLMATVVVRWSQSVRRPVSKLWLSVVLILNLAMVLVSGRRALQLVTMLSPLLILVLSSFQPVKEKLLLRRSLGRCTVVLVLAVTLSVLLLGPIYSTSFPGIAERFSSGFDFGANSFDDSPDARHQQYFALVRGWLENPLIGSGLGASAYGSTRSDTMPWAYELYYFLMLFHTGLLGFMAYTAGIVWIYWTGMKIIKRGGITSQSLLPVLVGMSGLLIATVTNPYLARFDGIWVIFLPLAFINHWLLKRDRAYGTSFEGTLQFSEQL